MSIVNQIKAEYICLKDRIPHYKHSAQTSILVVLHVQDLRENLFSSQSCIAILLLIWIHHMYNHAQRASSEASQSGSTLVSNFDKNKRNRMCTVCLLGRICLVHTITTR